ncbi:hypothetical protein PC116_g18849 [Phytophthora cactorum]|nr:hypothetical protein PC119_g15481 [Phytophthora cactorum]KAG3151802.1 hypothetical protein C6341_g16440 [Phytophthora cactorum]KAG3175815.1 hypothetical protein PC128_g17557 [Phytophthora cactorum]KAG4232923.1 hypothetical protein PC116_g18849 [Phytophthora cactorum]
MALDGAVSTKTCRRSPGFVCWKRRVQLGILPRATAVSSSKKICTLVDESVAGYFALWELDFGVKVASLSSPTRFDAKLCKQTLSEENSLQMVVPGVGIFGTLESFLIRPDSALHSGNVKPRYTWPGARRLRQRHCFGYAFYGRCLCYELTFNARSSSSGVLYRCVHCRSSLPVEFELRESAARWSCTARCRAGFR